MFEILKLKYYSQERLRNLHKAILIKGFDQLQFHPVNRNSVNEVLLRFSIIRALDETDLIKDHGSEAK
jgi:hypothetical protein